jgi:hypothetical protein
VWAYLPAIMIPLLGDLLADRLDVSAVRRTATPAEELQAGGTAGRVAQPANCLRVPSRNGCGGSAMGSSSYPDWDLLP